MEVKDATEQRQRRNVAEGDSACGLTRREAQDRRTAITALYASCVTEVARYVDATRSCEPIPATSYIARGTGPQPTIAGGAGSLDAPR